MMQASREYASKGHMEESATEAVTACDPGHSGWQLSKGWVFKRNQG
jgi:hypothetical protein